MKQKIRQDLDLGSNLRLLRGRHKYSQPEIVAKLQTYGINITRSYYSRIEIGELNVHVSILVALQDIYKCNYKDFFAGLKAELEKKSESTAD